MSVKEQSSSGEKIPELNSAGELESVDKDDSEPLFEGKFNRSKTNQDRKAVKRTLSDLVLKPSSDQTPTASDNKTTDNLVGQVLFDKYGISGVSEKTTCTITYKGRNLQTDEKVFLKTPLYVSNEISAAFKDYANKNIPLKHENIVDYIECLEAKDGRPYLVSKRIVAISLDDLLEEVGCISTAHEFSEILTQICSALGHAHEIDILHDSLKPENILLIESDGKVTTKVGDFGSRQFKEAVYKHIDENMPISESLWTSPESLRNEPLSQTSDVYQIGLIAYYILTGKPPYQSDSENDLIKLHCTEQGKPPRLIESRREFHNVEDIEKLLIETLDSDRDWRLQTAKELKDEIAIWLNAEPKSPPILTESEINEEDVANLKESKGDLKSTLHNLVALRKHQVQQEETVIMKFAYAAAKSGPRLSPQKAAAKLIITYVGGTLFLILIATYGILHWDKIQEAYRTHSISLSSILGNKTDAPPIDQDLPPIEGDTTDLVDTTRKPASNQTKSVVDHNPNQNQSPTTATMPNNQNTNSRRRVFRYEENPAYLQFIPKKKGSKPIIIE